MRGCPLSSNRSLTGSLRAAKTRNSQQSTIHGHYTMTILRIDNIVLKLSKEHKLINDYAVRFSRNLKNPDSVFMDDLKSFLDFLQVDLNRHFRMEELIFFPAALNGHPSYETSLLVLNLQKEHGTLETMLKAIQTSQIHLKEGKDLEKLLREIVDFMDILKRHARLEVEELFPMIDANENCLALIKKYADEVKSGG